MGHAHLDNITEWMAKRMYAKGKLTMREMVNGLKADKIPFQASEGEYTDYGMLAMGVIDVICFWFNHCGRPTLSSKGKVAYSPVIEPFEMTKEQQEVFKVFLEDGDDNIFMDDIDADIEEDEPYPDVGGRIGIFESIKWRYAKGWRSKYPKIPMPGTVTH